MLKYGVIVLPKLECEDEIRRLREEYDLWSTQSAPYISLIPPFTPATWEEKQTLNDYISQVRRDFHPFALELGSCLEVADRLLFALNRGVDELELLQTRLAQSVAITMLPEMAGPRLVVARVQDEAARRVMLRKLVKLERSIGLVDSISLVELRAEEMKLVANYPFGIGRVDFFDSP